MELIEAVISNNYELVKKLIEDGININFQDLTTCYTALIYASQKGYLDICKLLIDSGADVNIQDKHGSSPLMFTIISSKKDICELLIANGAGVNIQNCHGDTALTIASYQGKKEICELLINAGADVNIQDNYGNSSLIYSIINKDLKTIYRMLAIIILLNDIEFCKIDGHRHEGVYIKDEKIMAKSML